MYQAVLFDLDGTLVDTAPDLISVLNHLLKEYDRPPITLEQFRSLVSLGSKAMLKKAFGLDEKHHNFVSLRERFLHLYDQNIAETTRFFPEIDTVLTYLEANDIPWGIVTNKLTKHTISLLKALKINERPACVVCGDTLRTAKPDPDPIWHACKLIQIKPTECLFIGDSFVDITASKAAGMDSLVAMYGYIDNGDDPTTWQANGYVNHPLEIITWLKKAVK